MTDISPAPTKGLKFPKGASAGAELRQAMLEEMNQPVGTPPPTVETPEPAGLPAAHLQPVSHITSKLVSQQTDRQDDRLTNRRTDGHSDSLTDRQPDRETDIPTDLPPDLPPDRPAARPFSKLRISKAIIEKVKGLAKGKRAQVTLKLPGDMDEYITRHVRENWELKLLKQDIITRGIQLAILEIETGEKLADLD